MMRYRKWFLISVGIFAVAITIVALLLNDPSVTFRFLGYGKDGTGLLLLSNATEHPLDFYRPEIEILSDDGWTMFEQGYVLRGHQLSSHEAILMRVEIPDGRFTWRATAEGALESKFRRDIEWFL